MTALQHARIATANIVLLALSLITLSGCNFLGKPKTNSIPVPDPPKPVVAKEPAPAPKQPVELPPPPPIEAKVPEVKPEVAKVINDQKLPPKPKPVKKKVVAKKQIPAAPAPAEVPVGPPVEAAPVPKLGELMTDDQRAGLVKSCDQALARAQRALGQLKGTQLSNEQMEAVERIRTFISQAEQARQSDPQTARQLADRADLLSRDLVRSVR